MTLPLYPTMLLYPAFSLGEAKKKNDIITAVGRVCVLSPLNGTPNMTDQNLSQLQTGDIELSTIINLSGNVCLVGTHSPPFLFSSLGKAHTTAVEQSSPPESAVLGRCSTSLTSSQNCYHPPAGYSHYATGEGFLSARLSLSAIASTSPSLPPTRSVSVSVFHCASSCVCRRCPTALTILLLLYIRLTVAPRCWAPHSSSSHRLNHLAREPFTLSKIQPFPFHGFGCTIIATPWPHHSQLCLVPVPDSAL